MSTDSSVRNALQNPNIRRIDVHHHYFPSNLNKEKANEKLGWRTPEENLPWSPEVSLCAMDVMHVDFAVLSFPPLSTGSISEENRTMARQRNEFSANICSSHPDRFGFFATLPFLDDIEGCLLEIEFAMDKLHGYGISLSSCYGEGPAAKYIGSVVYYPIWAELNKRKAVVFLHGAQVPSSTQLPHDFLGIPITEAPNETFKAAAHLVVTGHRRKFPEVRIILAHLGGTAPFLAPRVAVLSNYMGCTLSPEDILDDFKTFYYETALSAYKPNLLAMDNFVHHDHLLFGSDFPAVTTEMTDWFTRNLQTHYNGEKLRGIMRDNAVKLFLGDMQVQVSDSDR